MTTAHEVNAMYDEAVLELVRLDAIADAAHDAMMKGTEAEATAPNGATYIAWSEAADKARAHRELWGFMGMDAKEAAGVLPDYARFGVK